MTGFARAPRLLKGALVGIDPANPVASVILFQYNPHTLTRTLQAQSTGAESGARAEVTRLKGAPQETITLEVTIDAIDQLEAGDGTAVSSGIHPQLAALEMLLYPKSAAVIANTALMLAGIIALVLTAANGGPISFAWQDLVGLGLPTDTQLWLFAAFALAFAAGAMIFVVVEEVIPETQRDKYTDLATMGFIGGFIVMMSLDVGLG